MRLIIEDHQYNAAVVKDVLDGITNLRDVDGNVSVNYVGYYFNPALNDCVFILPKVLMENINGEELVFGHCRPEEIIDLEKQTVLSQEEHDFIYELSVWIYRAIVVFRDNAEDTRVVLQQQVQQMSKGRLQQCNTFLDILLALQKFNRENQDFFFFILKNIHSGYNKINWTRTISKSTAIVQKQAPIYLNPVNKKRQINFDEELVIIYFSILNYMKEQFGFPVIINFAFPLITGEKFKNYLSGMGRTRLLQIKYKYFSDKALYLWELCFAFFDRSRHINIQVDDREYLLVKSFNIVFEAIIDELVGDKITDKKLRQMKEQPDGKLVDHLYKYRDLTSNEDDKPIYYIGDSKYYKRGHAIGEESIYKQFTYARNVIQWNIDLFNDGSLAEQQNQVKLRDDVTEGYNITPNFFISAQQSTLKREDSISLVDDKEATHRSRHFDNRLFDRDTFILIHYNVNFLFVVALYGRNNASEKSAWKEKVRSMFRTEIRKELSKHYKFYAMTAHADVEAEHFLRENFQMLLGKVFTPFDDKEYYSLALDSREEFAEENEIVLSLLRQNFNIELCPMGTDPSTVVKKEARVAKPKVQHKFLTTHWLENYQDANILIGCYKSQEHLNWIQGLNDKKTLIYNVRLDKERAGALVRARILENKAVFVVLYPYYEDYKNEYIVYRVHHTAEMDEERMRKAMYPEPTGKYFCYVFDEEITLGELDIHKLISEKRIEKDFKDGAPFFVKGSELIRYRK